MPWEMIFVFVVLVLTLVMMLREKLPPDLVAMLAFCSLLLSGVLTPAEAFRVFSNDAALTVAAMFVLSAALGRTGVIDALAHRLDKAIGQGEGALLLVMLPMVAVLSAFVNNTPVVVVFMPIMIALGASRGLGPSKLLIPLSFASILGGLCSLIGSSTNILASSAAVQMGQPPLGMFELGRVGWAVALAGLAYLLTAGRRLLKDRQTLASLLPAAGEKQYLTDMVVVAGSPLIGKKLGTTPLANHPRMKVLEVVRSGEAIPLPLDQVEIRPLDQLRLLSPLASVLNLHPREGVALLPKATLGVELLGTQKTTVAECVIGPRSSLVGRSIRESDIRRRHGVLVLAVHRQEMNLSANFADLPLDFGDTLVVEGPERAVNDLRGHLDFLVLTDTPATPARRHKRVFAAGAMVLVVALATTGLLPVSTLALAAAVGVVASGCLDMEEAYESVDWKIIFLIFGMLGLGMALEKTRGAELIARLLIQGLGGMHPSVVLAAVLALTSLLTNFLSNNAVAVLVIPVAVQAAVEMQVNPRPFLIAVAVGASACFATPLGYQTNTLVYGAGGYKFRDFIKVGLPLNILVCALAAWLIPRLWPF